MTATVTIYPAGVRTEVPVNVCRCPILVVGDACPVHQEILDIERHFHGTPIGADRRALLLPLILTVEECLCLLAALARANTNLPELPNDATELSAIVWGSTTASPMQRSLATALAEATYG